MNNSDQHLIARSLKKLKALTNWSSEKSSALSQTIASNLKLLPELIRYINENNKENESKILFEIGKYLKYSRYKKGKFIRHSYDSDNFFYMLFSGNIAKIDIKYIRSYVSFKEYISHLIKLKLLGENFIYRKCLKRNNKIFPFEEDIDILSTKDINIENYSDLIINIKEEINNSSWCQDTEEIKNINDFIELYNPKLSSNKFSFIGKESKYPAYLPIFIYDKELQPISFIGHLSQPKGIKFLSAYVCLSSCSVFYINKSEVNGYSNLYKLFQRKVSEDVIKKLFEGHFLFQDTDINFLSKNYSKYFYVQNYKKGQYLLQQNRPYEGIFFINSGVFQLKTRRTYHELNELKFKIMRNLDNFSKSIPDYKNKIDKIGNSNSSKKYENIYEGLNPFQIENFSKERDILFNLYKSSDVVGLKDIYDEKTGLNNFTVECISEEGEVYFLPNEIYTSMSTDETIKQNIEELVVKQCLFLLREINKNKKNLEEGIKSLSYSSNKSINFTAKKNILYLRKNLFDKFQNKGPITKRNHSIDYSSFSSINNSNNKNNFSNTFVANKSIKQKILVNQFNKNKTPRLNASGHISTKLYNNLKLKSSIVDNDKIYDKNNLKLIQAGAQRNNLSIPNINSINPFLTYRDRVNEYKLKKEENKNEIRNNNEKFKTMRTKRNHNNLFNQSKINDLLKQKEEHKKGFKNIKINENKKIIASIKILNSPSFGIPGNRTKENKLINNKKIFLKES